MTKKEFDRLTKENFRAHTWGPSKIHPTSERSKRYRSKRGKLLAEENRDLLKERRKGNTSRSLGQLRAIKSLGGNPLPHLRRVLFGG